MTALVHAPSPPHTGGWRANLALDLSPRGTRTVLSRRQHDGPLAVQKALYPEADRGICHLTLLHPPGGLASGDSLSLNIRLDARAHAVFATPGATKWYKADPAYPARQTIALHLGQGARLDWLPLENIYFNRSEVRQSTTLRMHPEASALGWDAVQLGRTASGENWAAGSAHADMRVEDPHGKPLWVERQRLSARDAMRVAPQGLAGFPAFGTLWAAGAACDGALAQALAPALPFDGQLRAGATSPVPGILLVRAVAGEIEPLRRLFITLWLRLRPLVHGVPGAPLRLWAT